ncbi:hypothetical protein BKA82DRAFT_4016895 [Pisolithus tinctorius]|nr:hypothetical protein BKA82DRAFT_4016895 [Pisolithus tinctorius]
MIAAHFIHAMPQKLARKGYNSARTVVKLKTKGWNVKNAFRIIANTNKHVIPVSMGFVGALPTFWDHSQWTTQSAATWLAGVTRSADMEGWCASVYNISNEHFEIKDEDDPAWHDQVDARPEKALSSLLASIDPPESNWVMFARNHWICFSQHIRKWGNSSNHLVLGRVVN